MLKFIFPSSPAWVLKRFILDIATPLAQLSVHFQDEQKVIVTIEKEGFRIDEAMHALLDLFGFHKTENMDLEEWYSETPPTEGTFIKAYILYAAKLLETYEKERADWLVADKAVDKREAEDKREVEETSRREDDEPTRKILKRS